MTPAIFEVFRPPLPRSPPPKKKKKTRLTLLVLVTPAPPPPPPPPPPPLPRCPLLPPGFASTNKFSATGYGRGLRFAVDWVTRASNPSVP